MSWYSESEFNKKDLSNSDLRKIINDLPKGLGRLAEDVGLKDPPKETESEEFEEWRDRALDFVNMISETTGATKPDQETPQYWGVNAKVKDLSV